MSFLSRLGIASAALFFAANVAEAGPITGTYNVTIYQAVCASCTIGSPGEQAQIGNPFITPADEIVAGTYTGALNWNSGGSGTGNIGAFIASGGGVFTPSFGDPNNFALSSAPFDLTTVMVITANLGGSVLAGNVMHDDGASLYDGGTGFANPVALSASPTSLATTPYSGLTGDIGLIYVEANGLPADLVLNETSAVPEPLTLSLFGALLAGAAAGLRRRQKKAVHA